MQEIKDAHSPSSLRSIAEELHRRARALEETAAFMDAHKVTRIKCAGSRGVKRRKSGAIDMIRVFTEKAWKAAAAVVSLRTPTGDKKK